VTRLKIAQELLSRVTTEPRNAVVVRAAIALAHDLEIEVIAEGVETAAHCRFLAEANCEQAQGYFFSRPVSVEQATDLLRHPVSLSSDHRDLGSADIRFQSWTTGRIEKAEMAPLFGRAAPDARPIQAAKWATDQAVAA